jgi:hypothetical protein
MIMQAFALSGITRCFMNASRVMIYDVSLVERKKRLGNEFKFQLLFLDPL